MSEAVNINRTTVIKQPFKTVTASGAVVDRSNNSVSFAQRQVRPKSQSTPRIGQAYVWPTFWEHFLALLVPPITSGECQPWNLSSTTQWDYLYGAVQNAPYPLIPPDPSGPEMERLVQDATTDCLLRLKNQKVNLGVSLAEAKETAELIGENAKRIARTFQSAYNRRPGDWLKGVRNAGRNWKKVPSYYLEYVYGVVPLMSDVDGACQALAESGNRGNVPLITAYGTKSDSSDHVVNLSDPSGQYGFLRGTGTKSLSARIGITADVPNWVMQDYNSLGVTNPFSIAWERVGYSHVVDWFLPIGDWINTWDVSNYLHFKSGYTTRYIRTEGRCTLEEPEIGTAKWSVREDLYGYYRNFGMRRETIGRFPTASFPSLRNPLSLDHMAQGLAMLSQVIGGHKKLAQRGGR